MSQGLFVLGMFSGAMVCGYGLGPTRGIGTKTIWVDPLYRPPYILKCYVVSELESSGATGLEPMRVSFDLCFALCGPLNYRVSPAFLSDLFSS